MEDSQSGVIGYRVLSRVVMERGTEHVTVRILNLNMADSRVPVKRGKRKTVTSHRVQVFTSYVYMKYVCVLFIDILALFNL